MASYLVTGSSRGLGLAIVKELSSQPASSIKLVLAATRSATPPAALSQLITSSSGRVVHIPLDVSSASSISSAVSATSQALAGAPLDVLINNAAITAYEPQGASGIDTAVLEDILRVNVVAVQAVSQAFLGLMDKDRGAKKLVNISSTMGSIAMMPASPVPAISYRVSKAALNALTVQWSMDLRPKGFVVTAVSPGWLKTDLGGEQTADLPVEVGAKEVIRIAEELKPEDTGRFRNIKAAGDFRWPYDGTDPVW